MGNDCLNPSSPCKTIQHAVDLASGGEVIKIAKGVYTATLFADAQVVLINKSVYLIGGYDSTFADPPDLTFYPTTISGENDRRGVLITGGSPHLENFYIIQGNATDLGCQGMGACDCGGGVAAFNATLLISGCIMEANTASDSSTRFGFGGGVALVGCDGATLSGNSISENTGSTGQQGYGGGAYLCSSDATVSGNTFQGNLATTASGMTGDGGGAYVSNSDGAQFTGNRFWNNTASQRGSGDGGGLEVSYGGATVVGNEFINNVASKGGYGYGGGVRVTDSGAYLQGNDIISNAATISPTAHGSGGGVYLDNSDSAKLDSNQVLSNTASTKGYGTGGGAFLSQSGCTLTGNKIAYNVATGATGVTGWGGGTRLNYSDAKLSDNWIVENRASQDGGEEEAGCPSAPAMPS